MDARRDAIRESYEAPPSRDRLPTLPEDLTEYAWLHTGPPSRSNEELRDGEMLDEANDIDIFTRSGALDELEAGLLVDLWHSDVPHLDTHVTAVVDEHEARILSLMDGRSTIGTMLETSGLAAADVLTVLCELCARGVITLDRSRRLAR